MSRVKRKSYGISSGSFVSGQTPRGSSQAASAGQVKTPADASAQSRPREGDVMFDSNGVQRIYMGGEWLRYSFY